MNIRKFQMVLLISTLKILKSKLKALRNSLVQLWMKNHIAFWKRIFKILNSIRLKRTSQFNVIWFTKERLPFLIEKSKNSWENKSKKSRKRKLIQTFYWTHKFINSRFIKITTLIKKATKLKTRKAWLIKIAK